MIDLDYYKESLPKNDYQKVELAFSRLKMMTPESRDQIMNGIEAMISCYELKEKSENDNDDNNHYNNSEIELLLKSKYDELKTLAKVNFDVDNNDSKIMALSKVLNSGTYIDGATAINLVSQINILCDKLHNK